MLQELVVALVVRLFIVHCMLPACCSQMHFMVYGSGLQTWEYSPVYALRSYAYLMPHAAVAYVLDWAGFDKVGVCMRKGTQSKILRLTMSWLLNTL